MQRIRNPGGGKNPQSVAKKDIKVGAKKNFKKSFSAPVSKPTGKSEEELPRNLQESLKQAKKTKEILMLERMKTIQLEQMDTRQACVGWSDTLHCMKVHVDLEAVQFAQKLKEQLQPNLKEPPDEKMQLEDSGFDEKIVNRQDVCEGSRLPHSPNNFQ